MRVDLILVLVPSGRCQEPAVLTVCETPCGRDAVGGLRLRAADGQRQWEATNYHGWLLAVCSVA